MDVPISNEVPDFYKKCESLKVNSYSSIAISENINNKLCKILSDVSNTDQDIHNHQKYDVLSKNLHKYGMYNAVNFIINYLSNEFIINLKYFFLQKRLILQIF